ncbi:unnamed protein product, partial [Heterosigma akashiwo]
VYDLPLDFNFARYMEECLDHYILELIEVQPSTWLFLILVALLNLGMHEWTEGAASDGGYSSSQYSSYSYTDST